MYTYIYFHRFSSPRNSRDLDLSAFLHVALSLQWLTRGLVHPWSMGLKWCSLTKSPVVWARPVYIKNQVPKHFKLNQYISIYKYKNHLSKHDKILLNTHTQTQTLHDYTVWSVEYILTYKQKRHQNLWVPMAIMGYGLWPLPLHTLGTKAHFAGRSRCRLSPDRTCGVECWLRSINWEITITFWRTWNRSQYIKISSGWWFHPIPKKRKSIGMMPFPIYGKIKNVPNHQPVMCCPWALFSLYPCKNR